MSKPIPEAALAQHIAILGKTGSGKTYAAKGVVEGILSAGGRACIIDPTGAWHGLRSSATGKSAGFPVVIFGGAHADLPLGAGHGEAIAEIIGTSSTAAILDTSLMKVGERTRFFADFAEALIRKNKGPLHLIVDEAHVFAPQGRVSDPQSGAMLHAANNLVSLGRSRGLRIMLITQRPAKLHKDSLTQVETLIALRLIAPQDRHAVEDWIKDNADEKKGREIIESLATLKTGHGWVWAPEIGVLERVAFPKIGTFDSSKAPDGAGAGDGPVLAPIDRDAIAQKLKAVGADALANDPAMLKREIQRLQVELSKKPAVSAKPSRQDLQAAEARGVERARQAFAKDRERAKVEMVKWLRAKLHKSIEGALQLATSRVESIPTVPLQRPERQVAAPSPASPVRRPTSQAPRASSSNGSGEHLPKGEAATLAACIQYPEGLRREQLTVLTGYKRSSRDAYIQRLREKGYVEISGDRVLATDEGIAAHPDAEPLPTGEALQHFWMQRLPEGERKILGVLIDQYPQAVARTDLDEQTGYQRSSRDAYLQRLRAKELVDEPSRGEVRASEVLFQ